MKKLILIAFLAVGTSSLAGSGKVVKLIKVKEAVSCCSVGEFTACGSERPQNDCNMARASYCHAHQCTAATRATIL